MALTKLRSRNGSTIVEAVLSLPLVLLAFLLLLSGFYALYLQASLHQQTYEYLLCAEFSSEPLCQQKLKRDLKVLLPFGRWQVVPEALSQEQRRVRVDFSLQIHGGHQWVWQYRNQINRDLSLSSS